MKPNLMPVAGLLLAAGAASAASQPPAPGRPAGGSVVPAVTQAPGEETTQEDGDKVRCKRMATTGSRVGKMVCHTEEEWAAMRQGARQFLRDIDAAGGPAPFGEGKGIRTPVGEGL
ncbi:hypothetical protein [Vulcaniibacterium gelatinicum]|uniref:hypothetical protein n=1 Tax=Vulcaniibacterium gelatinicum TaxID=2598725 RepID=UPI0011C9EB01|nr:hypothetical protein [Vulcaniibacterium gelatinicum]